MKLCKTTKKVRVNMFYKTELDYLMKVLSKMHLQVLLIEPGNTENYQVDFGFRKFLGLEDSYEQAFQNSRLWAQANKIYRLQDEFMCKYAFLMLPESPEQQALLVGPYITFEMSREAIMETAERFHVPAWRVPRLEEYYENVPVIKNELPLFSMITTFGEVLWGDAAAFELIDINAEQGNFSAILPEKGENRGGEDTMLHMKLMETRYEYENELMEMVAQGQTHRAETMLAGLSQRPFEPRLSDSLRNIKNYLIICNTLLRKAAERGGVHPIHLDSISSDFARKIESIPTVEKGTDLMRDMVRTYCRLVRKHSMKQYSPIVQKAVACIESGLSNDLSLSALASVLSVNASYLSALFRKETGKTVTEYVNEKRMKTGAHLLLTTRLQVQTVAQHCGISDVNYFSKIFKKHYGVTPKQFREAGQANPRKQ